MYCAGVEADSIRFDSIQSYRIMVDAWAGKVRGFRTGVTRSSPVQCGVEWGREASRCWARVV